MINTHHHRPRRQSLPQRAALWAAAAAGLLAILACNAPVGDSAEETPTVTATATSDVTPSPSPSPAPTNTPAEAAEEPEPAEPVNTQPAPAPSGGYNATYVADVTIPDGTDVAPSQKFDKTWRLRNSGTLAWPEGTRLAFVRGEQMSGPASVTVAPTAVGGQADITVSLTAPANTGSYRSIWQMQAPNGQRFGQEVYLEIDVVGGSAPAATTDGAAPTATPVPNQPDLVVTEIKVNTAKVYTNEEFSITITVKNEGGAEAAASQLDIDVEGDDDPTVDVPKLAAGATAQVNHRVTVTEEGDFVIEAEADSDTDVTEAREDNNLREITVDAGDASLVSSGSLNWGPNTCVQLDASAGVIACGSGADFEWNVNGEDDREISRLSDAEMRIMGTGQPTLEQCRTADLGSSDLNGDEDDNDIPDGTYICYETESGNFGWMKIDDYGETIDLEWSTWDIDT